MPRAILKNGVIVPVEPLPAEWGEGTELVVQEPGPEEKPDDDQSLQEWYQELNAMCSQNDPEEMASLRADLDEHRREAKEWMRRRMGLAE